MRIRKYVICCSCGAKLFYEDDKYEQDPVYTFEEEDFCEDCFADNVMKRCYVSLKENVEE